MPMSRADAAGLVGATFVGLSQDLNHLAKGTYDADAHNLCIAYVEYFDGSNLLLFAYSDSSKMNKTMKGFYEIPPSNKYGDHFGLSSMQAAHTEAKLLNYILNAFPSVGPKTVTHVTLATARDPCTSCTKVIAAYLVMHPGKLTVHGFSAQTGGGVPDLSGTPYG
ncbi:MAG: hypothetical protein JWO38_6838 [Gemmataceae bacterium]|nr:hypothetical protein [Gemmataceae bacterium]